jgi:hypothetical protein
VCWACDKPSDASKPFKSYKKQKDILEELKITEEHPKK